MQECELVIFQHIVQGNFTILPGIPREISRKASGNSANTDTQELPVCVCVC